jgi:Protein of unknown function (DUF1573)
MTDMRKYALALLATIVIAQCAAAQSAWADKLFGGVTSHDFGVVPRGAQMKYSFKITNIYKEPLQITQVRVSCTCLTATPSTTLLQPNESATLDISIDGRQVTGPKSVRIYVSVGPKYISTATLSVTANGRQDVVFSPGEVDFGNVARGQTPTRTIDVEYTGALEWKVTEIVKSAGAPFDLKVDELPRPANQPPRRGYRLFATLKTDPAPGPFKQEIILKTNDPASPSLTFNIAGTVQATLAVSPPTLAVSGLRVGESQTKKVVLRADRPFRVTGVDGLGDGVTADVPDRQDTTMILSVTIQPTKAGELRRQLTIRTDLEKEYATVTVQGEVAP